MRKFDYSFLEQGLLPSGLINVMGFISEIKTREAKEKDESEDLFIRLESIAKVQSIRSSNEIEGLITSEERINEIVNQNSDPLNHSEAEIAGYRDALARIHMEQENLDIRERDILSLHETLLSYTPIGGGVYKENDNVIVEHSKSGERSVRFAPISAPDTKKAMGQLLLAYMDARSNYNINQLLLIPCFILDFLCIHPFADGNGRMSRLLSLLLLYKNGFDAGRYISFEEQINLGKVSYYASLKESSIDWHENKNSYFPFMENFVTTLLRCYKELDKRLLLVNSKKTTKQKRIEQTVLKTLMPISKKEISYILPDVSPTTIEAVLGAMVKKGEIEKLGSGRSTKYIPS